MRKLFFLLLALVATTSLWAYDFKSGSLYYNITSSSAPYTVEVTWQNIGSIDNDNYSGLTTATIPKTVKYSNKTYSVTSIDDDAFENCSSLASVTIPNSVTSIGRSAFEGCTSLTSITIPSSITSIGWGAFSGCSKLTSITIPSSITSIGDYAFSGCSKLTSITIPNSVTSIGVGAFKGCDGLTSPIYNAHCFAYLPTSYKGAYTIPEGIKQIAGGAFYWCSSLTSITIPNSVTYIGDYAFYICSSLTSITIPTSVTYIGDYAFQGCRSLTSITIPNSVTSIGDWAFKDCSSLTSITIPNSVTSIGEYAFEDCSSLTSITIPNSVTSIGKGAFEDCSVLTSVTIPNSVTEIGGSAFSGCSSLTFITIPNSVTSIGYEAFSGCSKLTSITIPNSVTSIGDRAFEFCRSLTSVTINSNAIVSRTYYSSNISHIFGSQVTEYIIGEGVTSIGDWAFYDCSSLTSITCEAETPPTVGSGAFNGVSTSIPVYVPCGCVSAYKRASGWNRFTNIQEPLVEYSIQVSTSNSQMGTALVDYNTSCGNQISATANYGYHFVQWSDGNTDNPRTLTLTQDTVLTAEFAQTYSGKCGDNLYWKYDDEARQLTISGFGEMYNYTTSTQPWVIFKRRLETLSLSDEITKIGEFAFDGCVRIREITLGSKMEELADYSFTKCSSLQDIYCYAQRPPFEDRFLFVDYHYQITVHVPCDYLTAYQNDYIWQNFPIFECISSNHVKTDDVVVTPGTNDVTITWPTEDGADTYTIVIKKDGEVVCSLTFNADGQLLNVAFAPGRNGNHPAQYAEAVANGGYRFTVTGLEEGTHYTYNIDVKNTANQTVNSHTGAFTTQSTTAVENTHSQSPMTNCQKIFRNGQLIILRDGVEYNAMGQEIQ